MVSLHVPQTPETTKLIDAAALARMKPTRRAGQHGAGRPGGPGGAGGGAARAAGWPRRGWTCSRRNRRMPPIRCCGCPMSWFGAARGVADHRHVRPQLQPGGGELPAPAGGGNAAAPRGLTTGVMTLAPPERAARGFQHRTPEQRVRSSATLPGSAWIPTPHSRAARAFQRHSPEQRCFQHRTPEQRVRSSATLASSAWFQHRTPDECVHSNTALPRHGRA